MLFSNLQQKRKEKSKDKYEMWTQKLVLRLRWIEYSEPALDIPVSGIKY